MRMIWLLLVPAALLGLGGCNGSLFFWRKPARLDAEKVCEEKGAPLSSAERVGASMELQDVHYDGKDLSGRLLISPASGNLCLDKRLIEEFVLVVDAVSECDTGRDLGSFVVDALAPSLSEEDVLVLQPGRWYGKEISLFLFSEKITGKPSPECIEAELTFHALNVKRAAHLRVRATRTAPPTPNAGTPATAADAGR